MNGKKEFGDYQTPLAFAQKVCAYLKDERDLSPFIVIEPTCGVGNFLESSLVFGAKKYYGIEINPDYCQTCKERFEGRNITVLKADFFRFPFHSLYEENKSILIIGNPPWATNGMLSAAGSDNLPEKTNFKGVKGIEAMTGASNFDICEFMLLRLIREFQNTNTTIAMLCKTSVARNVFAEMARTKIHFSFCDLLKFDAKKVFGVSASACLLLIHLSENAPEETVCRVLSFDAPGLCPYTIIYRDGFMVSHAPDEWKDYTGTCCFEWRQGIKHDCSPVMELTLKDGKLYNGAKEAVSIESQFVYPLVKSSMFKTPIINKFSKYVIVTQKKPRENTCYLAETAPQTWAYLNQYKERFDQRKSSIYAGAPDFSIFGIGDYSFEKYKVGISGFYKKPFFSLLYSPDGKPVMTDDTSYFIGFDDYELAYTAMLILNSAPVQQFLLGISFLDSKRPFTKKVLSQLDFSRITDDLTLALLRETEAGLGLPPSVSAAMYQNFIDFLTAGQQTMFSDLLFNCI